MRPRTPTADQFRVIKRPLIANAMGRGAAPLKHGNLIMVTSALPGEGKSFTSINLAMSIAAELDNTVMLVDADVARPSVLRMLGLEPGPGLLDVLEGKVDRGRFAAAHQRRQADDPAQRHAASARHRTAGQRRHARSARRHGHPLCRPHHHLRFAATAADHRGARAGHAHGADRRRGARRTHPAGRRAARPRRRSNPARSR